MKLHLEILVEEPSLKESLLKLLPKILSPETTFTIHPYRGKEDLLKKLPSRLQGYKAWIPNHYKIIVLIDEDRQDCLELKEKLDAWFLRLSFGCVSTFIESPMRGFKSLWIKLCTLCADRRAKLGSEFQTGRIDEVRCVQPWLLFDADRDK